MQAFVTVIGVDRVGIIAKISALMLEHNVNISDITQTTMRDYFTMIMSVDLSEAKTDIETLRKGLTLIGEELKLTITIQHQDAIKAMHRI